MKTAMSEIVPEFGTARRKARAAVAVFVDGTLSRARSKERKVRTGKQSLMYSRRYDGLRSCTRFVVQQATTATLFEVAMMGCDMAYCIRLVHVHSE